MRNQESRYPFRHEPLPGTWENKDVRISERQPYETGFAITICDGEKHKTFSGGSHDTLLKIEPCNHECALWQEEKFVAIREDVPNFYESWVDRKDDYENPSYAKYREKEKFNKETEGQRDNLFAKLQTAASLMSEVGIEPLPRVADKELFDEKWFMTMGKIKDCLNDGFDITTSCDPENNKWTVSIPVKYGESGDMLADLLKKNDFEVVRV